MLTKITTHSTIVVGVQHYQPLVDEIKQETTEYLFIDSTDTNKNLLAEDIALIQDFIKTKSAKPRYVVSNRRIRSTETQNRILKLLEEGGENTFIIFVLETDTYLLPTILSRVQIVKIEKEGASISNEKIAQVKRATIEDKNFKELTTLLELERGVLLGTVTTKNLEEYLDMV